MPRYLFDIVLNGNRSLGDTWVDLPSPEEMRQEALKALQEIAIDEIAASDEPQTLTVAVQDEAGSSVYSATLVVSETWGSTGGLAPISVQ